MKVLVTGGAGFIGSWLIKTLLSQGHEISVIDNLSPQIHGAFPKPCAEWLRNRDVEFVRADIRDYSVLDNLLGEAEAVVHLAAETGTGQSMYKIRHYNDVNQQATSALFESISLRNRHVKRVVLASSRSIYGEGSYKSSEKLIVPNPRQSSRMKAGMFEPLGPNGETLELVATSEESIPCPASIYAATKLANEVLGRIFAEAYGTAVVALRFQNVYGEGQSLNNPYTGLLSIFSNRMRQNLPINIFEDGLESRDFVHVSDVVRAIVLALDRPINNFKAINVGSGIATSVISIAEKLRNLLNSSSDIRVTGDFRVGDIRHCYADLNLAARVLEFQPQMTIDEGLEVFTKWATTQPLLADYSDKAMKELADLGLSKI